MKNEERWSKLKGESEVLKSVLIVGPAWIGDMVMAQALFKLLKSQNPKIDIDVLAPAWTHPILERMPEVRTSILSPFEHGQLQLTKRYRFAKSLRKQKYDQAIILPSSLKSALIPFWAKIPVRTAWLGEWRIGLVNDLHINRKKLPQLILQFTALGLGDMDVSHLSMKDYFPKLSINKNQAVNLLKQFQLTLDRPVLGIFPGAEYGPAKRWPVENFATLTQKISSMGWQVWIFGSQKERELAASIVGANNECIDLTGKTSLSQAIDLMSHVSAAVTNDSGLMHIASALNIPLVVIYGSSSPNFTPPLSTRAQLINLNLECSPCFKRACPLGHFDCMKKITPQMVFSTLKDLINETNTHH